MSSEGTARTASWSVHVERLRQQRDEARRERDEARAELAEVKALHAHRLGTPGAWDDRPAAEEWESLHVGHEILPPAA